MGEDVHKSCGGTKWWQARPSPDGTITAEWIAMKKDWDGAVRVEIDILHQRS